MTEALGFDVRLEAEVFLDRCEALEEVIDFFGEAGCIAGRFVKRLQITAWLAKSVLGSLRGHRHSKALTVSISADNKAETLPDASNAPLPARDVACEGARGFFCHHKT